MPADGALGMAQLLASPPRNQTHHPAHVTHLLLQPFTIYPHAWNPRLTNSVVLHHMRIYKFSLVVFLTKENPALLGSHDTAWPVCSRPRWASNRGDSTAVQGADISAENPALKDTQAHLTHKF